MSPAPGVSSPGWLRGHGAGCEATLRPGFGRGSDVGSVAGRGWRNLGAMAAWAVGSTETWGTSVTDKQRLGPNPLEKAHC